MKKWLVVAMAFWLTSCSTSGDNKSYYQLPVAQGGVQSTASRGTVCCGSSKLQCRIIWPAMAWSIRPAMYST